MRRLNLFPIHAGLILGLLWAAVAFGADNGADAALVRDIEDHLIAPCCRTQPISEHDSAVSEQMREDVQSMVAAGMSREAILDHFVARYASLIEKEIKDLDEQ
jgi:cytochrome c-type biogenesis protein CcmH/NrfF